MAGELPHNEIEPPSAEAEGQGEASRIEGAAATSFGLDHLAETISGFAQLAWREGSLALAQAEQLVEDEFLRLGLCLAGRGLEAGTVRDILQNQMRTILRHQDTYYRMIAEGIATIQSGQHPRVVEQIVKAHYMPVAPLRESYAATTDELKAKLGGVSELGLDATAEVLTDVAILARTGDDEGLRQVIELIDERLLASGLSLIVNGADEDRARMLLETQAASLLERQRTRCRMIFTGILAILSGDHPCLVKQKLRALL